MDALLVRYESDRLAALSDDRGRVSLRVLRDLQARCDRADLARADAGVVRRLLGAWEAAGAHANTIRKYLGMLRAFYRWAYEHGLVSAETYLAVRAIKPPRESRRRAQPQPYRRKELAALCATLDERWPNLPPEEAWH